MIHTLTIIEFIEIGEVVVVDLDNKTVCKAGGQHASGIALRRLVKNSTAQYDEQGDTADIAYLTPLDYVYYGQ